MIRDGFYELASVSIFPLQSLFQLFVLRLLKIKIDRLLFYWYNYFCTLGFQWACQRLFLLCKQMRFVLLHDCLRMEKQPVTDL